jgi:hypothetical protein
VGDPTSYVDTGIMFDSFFTTAFDPITSLPYGYPFTRDPSNIYFTGQTSQYSFQNQTLFSVLNQVLLMSPANYYFRLNPDNTFSFNQYHMYPDYTLKIGQNITDMKYANDSIPRKNVIVVRGKGGVQAQAVGSSVNQGAGQRILFKNDSRITNIITAQQVANALLALYDRIQTRTTITIPDNRGSLQTGLGYDIEQFRVGQTVKILDTLTSSTASGGSVWGAMTWGIDKWGTSAGSAFNAVLPIVAISYNFHSVTLELGYRQPSENRAIHALEQRMNDFALIG